MGCIIMKNTKERRYKFMRLYNIYYVCKTCLPPIDAVNTFDLRNSNNNLIGKKVVGWEDCKIALNELYKIQCLREHVEHTIETIDFLCDN